MISLVPWSVNWSERIPWSAVVFAALLVELTPRTAVYGSIVVLWALAAVSAARCGWRAPGPWLLLLFPGAVVAVMSAFSSQLHQLRLAAPGWTVLVVASVTATYGLQCVLQSVLFPAPIVTLFVDLCGKRSAARSVGPIEEFSVRAGSSKTNNYFVPFARASPSLDGVLLRQQPACSKWLVYISGNDDYYEKVFDKLRSLSAQSGVNVLSYNPRGVGRSGGQIRSAKDLVDDAASVIQHLMQVEHARQEDILVFGHSLGGGVAAQLVATRFPQLSIVLDRSFSSLADAAAALAPPPLRWLPGLVHFLVNNSLGDFDSISAWQRISHQRKLITFHAKDHVILLRKSSMAASCRSNAQFVLPHEAVVEYVGPAGDHHDCDAATFVGFDRVMSHVRRFLECGTSQ